MKKLLIFSCLCIVFMGAFLSSPYSQAQLLNNKPTDTGKIHLRFRNNSIWPGKFALKIKSRGDNKYGVLTFSLFSYGKYSDKFEAGTRIYLINSEDQQMLMSGKEAEGKLLIEVKTTDHEKIVELIP